MDVTAQLQRHIDDSWGQCLLIPRDLNLTRLFGNPCPVSNRVAVLVVALSITLRIPSAYLCNTGCRTC